MKIVQSSFITWIDSPSVMGQLLDNAPIQVEVTYEMRDIGVMMRSREKVRAIPVGVVRIGDGSSSTNILPDLDWETYTQLSREAAAHDRAEYEKAKETWKAGETTL